LYRFKLGGNVGAFAASAHSSNEVSLNSSDLEKIRGNVKTIAILYNKTGHMIMQSNRASLCIPFLRAT